MGLSHKFILTEPVAPANVAEWKGSSVNFVYINAYYCPVWLAHLGAQQACFARAAAGETSLLARPPAR